MSNQFLGAGAVYALPAEDELVRLHCNQSPYGPPASAVAAATAELTGKPPHYANPTRMGLRERIAEYYGLTPESVAVGNDTDELILLTAMAFLRPGDTVVITESTVPSYVTAARLVGANARLVSLDDYRVPTDGVKSALADEVTLTYVSNPHNPCGTVLNPGNVEQILAKTEETGVIPLFDETYMEFADPDYDCAIDSLRSGRPLLVLRTFSKAWGLTSLRTGYVLGPADWISEILRAKEPVPISVNRLTQKAAAAALDAPEYLETVRERTARVRAMMRERLNVIGVHSVPSSTNFVLIRTPGDSTEIATKLMREHGILVRDLNTIGIPEHLRVSVGTEVEVDRFCTALSDVLTSTSQVYELNTGLGAPDGKEVPTYAPVDHTQLFNGYVGAHVVFAFNELGVWEHLLGGACELDMLAERTDTAVARLLPLLRVAALLGYLTISSIPAPTDLVRSIVRLTPAGREIARYKGYFTWGVGGNHEILLRLADLARGRVQFGSEVKRDGEKVAIGSGIVGEEFILPTESEVLSTLDFDRVADLGCGDGGRLIRLCAEDRRRRGVGIELHEHAAQVAVERIADAGLADRLDVVSGDLLSIGETRTFDGIDLVTCFFMMHDLFAASGDPGMTLRSLRKTFPDARWFIVSDTVSHQWDGSTDSLPIFSVEFELVHAFMDIPIGSLRTYEVAFAEAGLQVKRREAIGPPSTYLWLLEVEGS